MRQPPKPMRPPMGGLKPRSLGAPNPVGMKTPKPPVRPGFMADGGMGGDPGQDADDMGGGAKPSPDSLHYHAEEHECQLCEYMGQGGKCAILGIQVAPEGACNAFEANEGGTGEELGGEEPGEMAGPPSPGGSQGMYGG